ncbi:hypothetical protein ACU4GH_31765 [Bradyrhizobium betae]
MIIVNGIDKEKTDLPALLADIRRPSAKSACRSISRRARQRGRRLLFQSRRRADFLSVASAHDALVDQVVEIDPELMELYLEQGQAIAPEQLHAPFGAGAARRPTWCRSVSRRAASGAGIGELLDVFVAPAA